MEDDTLTLGEQFGNNGMNSNAFSYQPIPSAPLPTGSMYPDWVNKIESPVISKDITPEINNIVQDIRYSAMDSLQTKGKSGTDSIINEMFPNKIQTQYDVPITQTHELLSDGKTWIPKYKSYLPGVDNEVLNANNQSNWEKYFNPLKRFGIKVSRGIVADIGSFVYGIGEAAITGRAESVFDNGMSNYIDDLDKKTDFNYKNYYTEAQNGLGANLYTWDKILGGAEFTARMLGAEAIIAAASGGASLPASFARAGARIGLETGSTAFRALRTAETLEDVAEIGARASKINRIVGEPIVNVASKGGGVFSAERYAQGLQSAINAGNKADLLKQARFAITGSMYESGFEARHYQTEAENTFWDYYRQKGIEPTQEEIDNFYGKLDDTSWAVFGANMGILSASNMALFGNMMNIKNPFTKLSNGSFLDRSVFRVGTEKTAEGLWKPIKKGFFNKAAAFATPVIKGAAVEGVFEEGLQGVASNMMKNYIASTYDPKAMKETSNYMNSFTKAFKDQYSTKEGLEEVIIGGIIGGLFGGVHAAGEVQDTYNRQGYIAQVQNAMPQVADNIVSNLYTNESLSNIIGHSNRLQNIGDRQNSAKINGDIVGDAMHSAESFISMLQASSSVGKTDEFLNVLKASLSGMDASQLAEGQNIRLEDVDAFKQEKIAGINKLSEDYSKAREAATYLFGRGSIGGFYEVNGNKVNKQNLIDAFAYTSTMGSVAEQISSDAFNAFQTKLAEIGTDPSIVEQYGSIAALQTAGNLELARYTQASNDEQRLLKQQKKIQDDILKAQNQESTPGLVEKLQELGNKLIELGEEINNSRQNKDLYWKGIADNFYKNLGTKGYLPQIDLNNFNKKIIDLKGVLDKSSLNEYDKLELNKLLEEFDKSNEAHKSFNNLAQAMANPKFTFKIYNNIFSGFRAKSDKSLNDFTKTALTDLYNTNTKIGETLTSFQPTPSLVTNDVISSINNDPEYQVPIEIIEDVTNKVKNNNELSENEKQIYNLYKNEIDTSINSITDDPINVNSEEADISPITAQISALRNEITELENGNITPSIQSEIDSINKQIDDLKLELNNLQELNIDETPDARTMKLDLSFDKGNYSGSFLNGYEFLAEGSESTVFKSEDGTHVIKIGEHYGSNSETLFNSRINSALLGNEALGDNSLELIGYEEYNGVKNPVYRQNFISGDALTEDQVKTELIKNGAVDINGKMYFRYKGKVYEVIDFTDNYFRDADGNMIGIDVSMYETKDSVEGLDNIKEYKNPSKTTVQESIEPIINRQDEIENQIASLEDNKQFLIDDRIIDLNDNIDDLKSKEESDKKLEIKKEKLAGRIGALRENILREISQEVSEERQDISIRDVEGGSIYRLENVKENDQVEIDRFKEFLKNFPYNKSYSGIELKRIFDEMGIPSNKNTNKIWNRIKEAGEAMNVKIFLTQTPQGGDTKIAGTYTGSSNTIVINIGNMVGNGYSYQDMLNNLEYVLTHEMIHGVTMRIINNYDKASDSSKKTIDGLIAKLENLKTKGEDHYGLTNIKEMTAELANPSFRNFLNRNDSIMQSIMSLLGINYGNVQKISNAVYKLQQAQMDENMAQYYDDVETNFYDEFDRSLYPRYSDLNREIRIRKEELLKKPYYTKLRKLRKLESELRDLNKIKPDFNPEASYYDQLQWILDNSSIINFENVENLSSATPPSTEDIGRYSDLVSKKRKTKLETAEMADLREKLLPYRIIEGSYFGGIPLIDIINVYNQLKSFKNVEDNQLETVPEEDVQRAIYQVQVEESSPEYRAPNVGLVYDGAYLRGGSNIQRLFHIRLNTILNAALNNNLDIELTEFTTKDGNVNYSDPITVDGLNINEIANKYDNFGGVRINIGDQIILEKSEKGVNFSVTGDIASLLNVTPYAITGQPNSYNLLYEQKSDGSLAPKESEYQVTRDGNEIPFDKETLNKLKTGDDVSLFFDINDDYNKSLNSEDYISKGNIYVLKNGNLVNILKANTNYETNESGWAALANLRKQVVEAASTNQTVNTTVKTSYLGLPIINIDSNGKALEQNIIEDQVVSYGYMDQSGNYNFFEKNVKVDNSQYTDPYKDLNKNIPLMAFRYNDRVYTFPVQVKSENINAESELDNILNNDSNEYVKMFEVNSLLEKYNLNNNELAWTIENNTITAIREALSSVEGKVDITNENQFKDADKTTLIDMNDPFMSSKLVLDMRTAQEILDQTQDKTKEDSVVKPNGNKGKDLAEDNMC